MIAIIMMIFDEQIIIIITVTQYLFILLRFVFDVVYMYKEHRAIAYILLSYSYCKNKLEVLFSFAKLTMIGWPL